MKSSINLLSGVQKQGAKNLPAVFLLRILLAYFSILVIIWGMAWSLEWYQKTALNQVTAKQDSASKQWAELQTKYAMQEKIDEHTKYWAVLLKAKRQRYSRYLRDLALQVPQGVWLEKIEVGRGGNFIKLGGKTFNPPMAMILLQNLITAPAFMGKKFKIFDLSVVPSKSNANQKLASLTVQTE